jgi:hypothetical protein
VDNASSFPGSGTLKIDAEQISYTGKLGNTFTGVQRGVNGTTATAHPTGSAVRLLSSTVPTPPRPTATLVPRDIIYQTIGEGSGCMLQTGHRGNSHLFFLTAVVFLMWNRRRRGKH